MFDFDDVINISPYSLDKSHKEELLNGCLSQLTVHHYENSKNYRRIMDSIGFDVSNIRSYYDIPFLPVRLFKEYDMLSIDKSKVEKTMTSSGTTGQQVSKIYLNRETAANQTKALTKIVSSYIGVKRLPMIILDTSAILKDRYMFSARGAGILGFSMFGYDKRYALDENMKLDIDGLKGFLEKHKGENIFLFGFTFMIWQHFYNELRNLGTTVDISKGILIHGGGWKKLVDQAVSPNEFKHSLKSVCGIDRV
ncbi:MAG: LuxE/PaaK family acyltransferase, partial [Ruminiclostridium sp.]